MATQAHCAFCFETLSSHLHKTHSLSLREVESLWKQWNNGSPLPTSTPAPAPVDDLSDSEYPEDPASPHRPLAISRLLAPSPATASSSSVQSVASTPSRVSDASSATSAASKSESSSRSSFFGLGKRLSKSRTSRDGEEGEAAGEHPLFVTWNIFPESGGERRLRGCIGTFEALELEDGLQSYALTSALDDTRFNPISASELPHLEVGVTLLTNFEPASHSLDWDIGTHGLRISFTLHGRRYGSTYLPDVAMEQGWTKEETMVSLMRKAGWNGRREDWTKVDLSLVRYQGRQVRLGYGEWESWRSWVEGVGR